MTEKKLRDDIIVKMLDYRDEEYVDINEFCSAKNITFSSDNQKERIFEYLKKMGYIECSLYMDYNGHFTLTSEGIDYAKSLLGIEYVDINEPNISINEGTNDTKKNPTKNIKSQSYIAQGFNKKIIDNNVEPCFNVESLAKCYVDLIDRACEHKENNVCMFGIFAPWGRGKSYFFKKIEEFINKREHQKHNICCEGIKLDNETTHNRESKHYDIVEFNAWKYQETPAIWAYLFETLYNSKNWWFRTRYQIKRIYKSILRDVLWFLIPTMIMIAILFFKNIIDFVYHNGLLSSTILIGLLSIIGLILDFISKHCFSAISLIKKYSKGVSFANELGVQAEIEKEITALLKFWIKDEETDKRKKVILYVDDIDRCSETKMTSIIDSLRTVLENEEIRKRLIIICSIDQEKIIKGIEYKYKKLYDDKELRSIAIDQMDKIFLTGIALSQLNKDQLFEFASKLAEVEDNNSNDPTVKTMELNDIIRKSLMEEKRRALSYLKLDDGQIYLELKNLIKDYTKQLTPRKIRIIYYRILLANNIICNKKDSMITKTLIKNIFNLSVGNEIENSDKSEELSDVLNMVVPYRYNKENKVE